MVSSGRIALSLSLIQSVLPPSPKLTIMSLSSVSVGGHQPFWADAPTTRYSAGSRKPSCLRAGSKTSALGTVTVPVEALLKRITGSHHAHGDRGPVPCLGDVRPSSGRTVGSCRMSVHARASELVKIVYDAKDGAYYLQLDVEVDMPTASLGEEILAHVKPTSSSPTRDNFDEVPISQIRELGHSGTAVWQSYKSWNKWHKTKHRAVFFVQAIKTTSLGLPLDGPCKATTEEADATGTFMNGLNANAPEFTPCSSAPSPPSDSGGAVNRGSLDDGHALEIGGCLLPSEVAALLSDDCLHEEAFDSDLSCSPIGHPAHHGQDYHDGWRASALVRSAAKDPWMPSAMDRVRCRLTSAAESSTTSSSLAPANESPSRATDMW